VSLTRRSVLVIGTGAAAAAFAPNSAFADERESHGISAFGDLKYPADFQHFDYVNPNAPKGGTFSHVGSVRQYNQSFLTFNSLNGFVLRGDAALGIEMTFVALMTRALDEPDALYGLAAQRVRISADRQVYRFVIRPEARFNDGTRLTAHDAAWSLTTLKEKGHPIIRQLMRDVEEAKAEDDATLMVRFNPKRGREIPLFVASLPIFSRAYYATGTSRTRRSKLPLAPAHTRWGGSRPAVTSNMTVSRTGGAPVCPWRAAREILTPCGSNFIATATSPSRVSPPDPICSARSSRPASGRHATTSRPSRMVA
jgi:ABC-type oligopeptide transport system substrate-binding subunit